MVGCVEDVEQGRGYGERSSIYCSSGHDGALQLELDRRVVDAAASYMASEDSSSAYLFSG